MTIARTLFLLLALGGLTGCGLTVPELQEWYEPQEKQKISENLIINHVRCELHKGLDAALAKYGGPGRRSGFRADWIENWLATVTLKLAMEEKGSINPGVSWVRAFSDVRSFTLGAGLNAAATATRVENISFTYSLRQLRKRGPITAECAKPGMPITGDLKIAQFLDSKIFLTTVPGTIPGPYSAFNYQVTFVVVYGGSATPTWKLVDITANPDAPFLNAARTRTHDITITIAPPEDKAAEDAAQLHNAALIGQAVASALRRAGN